VATAPRDAACGSRPKVKPRAIVPSVSSVASALVRRQAQPMKSVEMKAILLSSPLRVALSAAAGGLQQLFSAVVRARSASAGGPTIHSFGIPNFGRESIDFGHSDLSLDPFGRLPLPVCPTRPRPRPRPHTHAHGHGHGHPSADHPVSPSGLSKQRPHTHTVGRP
jgi:hypothetical protein